MRRAPLPLRVMLPRLVLAGVRHRAADVAKCGNRDRGRDKDWLARLNAGRGCSQLAALACVAPRPASAAKRRCTFRIGGLRVIVIGRSREAEGTASRHLQGIRGQRASRDSVLLYCHDAHTPGPRLNPGAALPCSRRVDCARAARAARSRRYWQRSGGRGRPDRGGRVSPARPRS